MSYFMKEAYTRPEQMTLDSAPRYGYRGVYRPEDRANLPNYYWDENRNRIDWMYGSGLEQAEAELTPARMVNPYYTRFPNMRMMDLYRMYAQQEYLRDAYGGLNEIL